MEEPVKRSYEPVPKSGPRPPAKRRPLPRASHKRLSEREQRAEVRRLTIERAGHRADALAEAVQWFRESIDDIARHLSDDAFASEMSELRGRDLACWCPLDQPCHADVLLELAND